jgi:F0F1-type ATP synthase membrane subunit b/b'
MYLLALFQSVQLFPDGTIFFHIALILLMIWILNRTFFRPVNRVLESRAKFKGGHNVEAEEIMASASEKKNKFTQAMLAARSEGYELIEKERAAAVAARTAKVNAAKAETAASLAEQKRQLESQAAETRTALAGEAAQLADKITSNILKS